MTGSCFSNALALPHDPRDRSPQSTVCNSHKSQLTYILKLRFRASDGSVLSLSFLPFTDLNENNKPQLLSAASVKLKKRFKING